MYFPREFPIWARFSAGGTAKFLRGSVAMKALCVTLAGDGDHDPWLTLNRQYKVLSVLITPKGPARLRVIADDGRTPILAEASLFGISSQPLPSSWVLAI